MTPSLDLRPAAATRQRSAAAGNRLGDFRTNRRVLLLSALALPVGAIGAVVAKALLWLIAVITNAVFFLRFSSLPVTPQEEHLGALVVIISAPVALIIGVVAHY